MDTKALSLGPIEKAVESRLQLLDRDEAARRLWEKDPTLWKREPSAHASIKNRLGWLDLPASMKAEAAGLETFARELKDEGVRHALLVGMGGSSLAPEVLALTFAAGIELKVLDSTVPAAVLEAAAAFDPKRTVYIVSSKSGTTIEIVSLFRHVFEKVKDGSRFVAITDPGTALESQAKEAGFRRVFATPEDVGGRYSALTFFGLLPAALVGADPKRLLGSAEKMAAACGPKVRAADNPGVRLGAALAEAALGGRDKLTLLVSPELAALGSWIEQLVAESTGKEGRGIVPIDEPPGAVSAYGKDRVFVQVRYAGSSDPSLDALAAQLSDAEQPVLRLDVADRHDLGAEFFRWEVATAIAGAVLGINPFDEPNVSESKEITRDLLSAFEKTRAIASPEPAARLDGLTFFADDGLKLDSKEFADWLEAHLGRARPVDFAALLAFLKRTPETDRELDQIRRLLRDRKRLATTVGYGPRYLHSTGQLFKGGSNCGLFFVFTGDDPEDAPIPGASYGFSALKQAQAFGDFLALKRHKRRAARIHLTGDPAAGLAKFRGLLADILSGARQRA